MKSKENDLANDNNEWEENSRDTVKHAFNKIDREIRSQIDTHRKI